MATELDALDRRIIEATQAGLPLGAQPFHLLAEELGEPVGVIMSRIQHMRDQRIIRRIAAVPNHYTLGFRANAMSVWDVDDAQVQPLGSRVGRLDFVSHCYRRPRRLPVWPYNLFAMVHGRGRDEVNDKVQHIAILLGSSVRAHDVLLSTRILKKTGMRLARVHRTDKEDHDVSSHPVHA